MTKKLSLAQLLASLSPEERERLLAALSAEERDALAREWRFNARPDQLPPDGDWWRVWLFCAGRGAGKSRAGAEWCIEEIRAGRRRAVGCIGPTADSVRRVMVEGPSGILASCPEDFRADYEPSVRRIRFPNGALIHLFSAEEPERLRGPNLDLGWCDELCAWSNAEAAWSNLQLALRLPGTDGSPPRVMVSTTPKPTPIIKALVADAAGENPSVIITRASTFDNRTNLDPATLAFFEKTYGNSHLAKQELLGQLIEDAEGALWTRALIEKTRATVQRELLERIVVAVDPSGGTGRGSGECGIVVAGQDWPRPGRPRLCAVRPVRQVHRRRLLGEPSAHIARRAQMKSLRRGIMDAIWSATRLPASTRACLSASSMLRMASGREPRL